ncbi:MAG: site-specific integrase [Rhodospirillales bacterium]|nr:site-specific integrase [Rhodospirillales bacterium]
MWNAGQITHLKVDDENGAVQIAVFPRPKKNGVCFYARYKVSKPELAGNRRSITRSLKTDDHDTACERARVHFQRLQIRQEENTSLIELTVNQAVDKFLDNYEKNFKAGVSGFSKHMLRNFKKSIDIYWKEYVGERLLNSIAVSDFEGYEIWRRSWAKSTSRKRKHGNYKSEISSRTVLWEINNFKVVLTWCAKKRSYNGQAHTWQFKGAKRTRRSAFTDVQVGKLTKYLESSKLLQKGKHGHDWKIQRHRTMLRFFIYFMLGTGLRPGEARYLKWKDIEFRTNSLGNKYPLVRVSSTHTKTKKSREVVGNPSLVHEIEYWKIYRENIGDLCKSNAYVFCDINGKPIQDFREGFNNVISEAGVEFDSDGNKLVIYSMRHTYITTRLRYGKNLNVFKLAQNCGTSVQMIEQFYSDVVPVDFADELTVDGLISDELKKVDMRKNRFENFKKRASSSKG